MIYSTSHIFRRLRSSVLVYGIALLLAGSLSCAGDTPTATPTLTPTSPSAPTAIPTSTLLGVSGFGQFWVREIGVKKLLV